jgi:hypothetical protein
LIEAKNNIESVLFLEWEGIIIRKKRATCIFCETRLLMSVEVYSKKSEPPRLPTDRDSVTERQWLF